MRRLKNVVIFVQTILSFVLSRKINSDLFVRFFQMEGLSLGVSEVVMASWRPGMKRVYNRTVQRWLEYCRRWGYHTQHPTVSEVLDFLHALFTQGLGYSAKIAIVVP